MKKVLKTVLAAAMALSLTACGSKTPAARVSKAGLGIVTSVNAESGQINTTFAVVGLDAEGKIVDIAVDVAQTTPGPDAKTTTKKDLQDGYGMRGASAIGKEWFEQIAAFEEFCKGKTAAEIAAIETYDKGDGHHTAVPAEGSDLAVGCTMDIGSFKEVVAKAVANAVDAEADKVVVGHEMAVSETQMDLTVIMLAVDAEGKIVTSKLDVAQIKGADETRTKLEKQGDYGMVGASGIGKEWFEQAAAFDAYLVGKTAADVAAIETYDKGDGHHTAVPAEGSDLAAGCTMDIGSFKVAVADAFE